MDKFLNYKSIYLAYPEFYTMENDFELDERKIRIKVSELIKKFKTKQDICDYCREHSNLYI